MDVIGIIGFGRFGKILAKLLKIDHEIKVYDTAPNSVSADVEFVPLSTLLNLRTIFVAVPIRQFSNVIQKIAQKITHSTTIIDVCSVKLYPVNVMQQYLPADIGIIATHPMFGPDSFSENKQLKLMMHNVRDCHHVYDFWKDYFHNKNIKIIEMTPEEHDYLVANSQGITHFIGRALEHMHIEPTPIDTEGFSRLLQVVQQTCNDSWELFVDLQNYNPYSKEATEKLLASLTAIKEKISR